jgi:hypothetical protein
MQICVLLAVPVYSLRVNLSFPIAGFVRLIGVIHVERYGFNTLAES